VRYASVCDGIGAAHAAWRPLGWECSWTAEIAPFPAAVITSHYPGTINLGDITKITEKDLDRQQPIDLLVGGTPCQSFSVAGLRGGLADSRGNLALRFFQLAGALRPSWVVWENVPGVLSSDKGRDFGTILGALGQLGYGFAYRILDAQYFGVPQRRRRVFVVGYLGDWRRAAEVLFERESLSGNPAPSRRAGERIAGTISPGAHPGGANGQDAYAGNQVARPLRSSEDGTGRGTPIIAIQERASSENLRHGPQGSGMQEDCAFTMEARRTPQAVAHFGVRRITPLEAERLQGFPDHWTAIQYRGKPAADAPRYCAIGNSMAVPCMVWLGQRIQMVEDLTNAGVD